MYGPQARDSDAESSEEEDSSGEDEEDFFFFPGVRSVRALLSAVKSYMETPRVTISG